MDEANRLTVGPMGFSGKTSLIGCKIGALNRLPGQLLRVGRLRLLGVPPPRRPPRRDDRRDHDRGCIATATPSQPMLSPEAVAAGFPRTGREIPLAGADHRGADSRAQGRRRRPDLGPDVHRPRRRPRAPDEARAAGRPARRRPLSLRSGGGEGGGERLARHRRGSDDQHPRGAVSGRHHRSATACAS